MRLFNYTVHQLLKRFQGSHLALVNDVPTRLASNEEPFGMKYMRGIAYLFRGRDAVGRLPPFTLPASDVAQPCSPVAAARRSSRETEEEGLEDVPLDLLLQSEVPVLQQILEDIDEDLRDAVVGLGSVATVWPSTMGSVYSMQRGHCYGD
jgi:hypothetical protein